MGFFTYARIGYAIYEAYEDGKFDRVLGSVANHYPTMYNKVGEYVPLRVQAPQYGHNHGYNRVTYY